MKTRSRIGLVLLILALILPLTPAGAQEEVEIAEDLSGFYTVNATSGALAPNDGDETYTLTLQGVPETLAVVVDKPYLFAWRVSTLFLIGNWAAAPGDLEASAVLEVDGVTVWLTLTAPAYDDEAQTLSFTAQVTGVYNEDDTKETKAPESFETAALFIYTDHDFEASLLAGLAERGGRFPRRDRRIPPRKP